MPNIYQVQNILVNNLNNQVDVPISNFFFIVSKYSQLHTIFDKKK